MKLPSLQFAAIHENEYAMLELARAVGIQVPAIRPVRVADIQGLPPDAARMSGQALAVERFDRAAGGRRIHMEDFAQVFGLFPDDNNGSRSYANIAAVLWAETGDTGTCEFVRRLVFPVLIGNADMHLKNWLLLYPDGRTPVLSPAYDFVSIVSYIPGDTLALAFSGSPSLGEITLDQARRFADTARLPMNPGWGIVGETMERTAEAWKALPCRNQPPNEPRKIIGGQIQKSEERNEGFVTGAGERYIDTGRVASSNVSAPTIATRNCGTADAINRGGGGRTTPNRKGIGSCSISLMEPFGSQSAV